MHLQQPSRRIVVEIVAPAGPVAAKPAAAKEPPGKRKPQPKPQLQPQS